MVPCTIPCGPISLRNVQSAEIGREGYYSNNSPRSSILAENEMLQDEDFANLSIHGNTHSMHALIDMHVKEEIVQGGGGRRYLEYKSTEEDTLLLRNNLE